MQTFQKAKQGSSQKLSWAQHYVQLARTLNINKPTCLYRSATRPFQHNQCKRLKHYTPLEAVCQLLKATPNDKLCDPTCYQELVGSLNHLAVFSHPDISFAVSKWLNSMQLRQ